MTEDFEALGSFSDISSASSISGNSRDLFSLAPSEDSDTPLESPVSFTFSDDARAIDSNLLAGANDVTWQGFETCGDKDTMGWYPMNGVDGTSELLQEWETMQLDEGVLALHDGQAWTGFNDPL